MNDLLMLKERFIMTSTTIDLTTSYMGLKLEHPIIASASPLTYTLDGVRRLADAGAAAIVMHSLFEEQLEHESKTLHHFLEYGTYSFAEALDYFPQPQQFRVGPDDYLELIRKAKASVGVPIIGSLNGASPGGWTRYAKLIEEAGADGLELNLYFVATNSAMTSTDVESMYLSVLRDVREVVSIPIAVKLSPYFSSFAHIASRFAQAGADALVLFNRFYQPDFDLENLEVTPNLVLSQTHELRLPLTWVAILYGRVPVDLAITSGVHSQLEVLKGLMAGANVTMMTSELLSHGVGRIGEVLRELRTWLQTHEYVSIKQLRGSMSQQNVSNPDAFERANYMKMLQSWRPEPTGKLSV
jgi:dihydroorotate dehydrogenase (fumarate)